MVVVVSMREPLHRSTLYTADTSNMLHFYLFLDFGVVLSSYSFVKLSFHSPPRVVHGVAPNKNSNLMIGLHPDRGSFVLASR